MRIFLSAKYNLRTGAVNSEMLETKKFDLHRRLKTKLEKTTHFRSRQFFTSGFYLISAITNFSIFNLLLKTRIG